jgi:hypothetical protein
MTHDRKPPRQPLFWAALAFSFGLRIGVRAWRPPSLWVIAVVAFVFAASWFLPKRAWMAKALPLGAWFLLGAFLIQVRGQQTDNHLQNDARILALADGRDVTLTARVIREGYAQAAGPRSIRESIDVETEEIASQGERWPARAGVRLTIYEKVENSEEMERRASPPGLDAADPGFPQTANRTGETPVAPLALTMARGCAFTRSCIRRAITAIPEPSTVKVICATTASWKRERNFCRSALDRSSALCGHFRRRAKCLRTSPA